MTIEEIKDWRKSPTCRCVTYAAIDTLLERITELEKQLSRYQGGVEVEGVVDLIPMGMMRAMQPIIKLPLGSFAKGQKVRVLVIPEERIVDTNKTMEEVE